jgi:hypothetical protein
MADRQGLPLAWPPVFASGRLCIGLGPPGSHRAQPRDALAGLAVRVVGCLLREVMHDLDVRVGRQRLDVHLDALGPVRNRARLLGEPVALAGGISPRSRGVG